MGTAARRGRASGQGRTAQALSFIAPVISLGFQAIPEGWIERVLSLGFAFGMTADAWRGEVGGRLPLLTHRKTSVIQATIWTEASHDAGLEAAMTLLVDEYALRQPGIQWVGHVCFHAVHGADDATRRAHLDRACTAVVPAAGPRPAPPSDGRTACAQAALQAGRLRIGVRCRVDHVPGRPTGAVNT